MAAEAQNISGPISLPSTFDWVFTILSLSILSGIGVRWIAGRRAGPLARAPQRRNHLGDDAVLLAVAVFLLASVGGAGIVHFLEGSGTGDSAAGDSPTWLLVGSGVQLLSAVACVLIAAPRFEGGAGRFFLGPGDPRESKRLAVTVAITAGVIILALGLCPIVLEATMAAVRLFAPAHDFEVHPTIEALRRSECRTAVGVLLWMGAAVIAPVAEEVFFRGLVQTFLVNVFRSRWTAIVVTSLAFSAVHVSQAYAMPALALLSILIGYAYERTGSLISPIVIHSIFNLKALVWDWLGTGGPSPFDAV